MFLEQEVDFLDDLMAKLEKGGVGMLAGEVDWVGGFFPVQFSFGDNEPYP